MANTKLNKILLAIMFTIMIPVLLGSAQQADAANLGIDDSTEAEITFNVDPNWEGGSNPGAGSTTIPGESAGFTGSWITLGNPGNPNPGSGVIYFVDPVNPNVVSDIVTASWNTPGFNSDISIDVQSTACGGDLGPLPAAFAGLGVTEPAGSIQIGGSFRDSTTGNPVSIPPFLTIQFVSSDDAECPIGGEIIPIEATSLILAGAQSSSWMIPVVLSILGIGLFAIRRN